jgi:hypothetical protein
MPAPSALSRVRERIESELRETGRRPAKLSVGAESFRALVLELDAICTVVEYPRGGLDQVQIDGVEISAL